MDTGRRIHELRRRAGMTARELGERVGVSQSYISLLENSKRRPNVDLMAKIARVFNLTLSQFFAEEPARAGSERAGVDLDRMYRSGALHAIADREGNVSPVRMRAIPVVSRVAAGDPAGYTDGEYPAGFAEEFVAAPSDLSDPTAFALRIEGESMAPRFRDGDIVICSPEQMPENGDAVVARLGAEETTCKLFSRDGDRVILSPVNPSYPTQVYEVKEISWAYPVVICQRREKR